MNFSSFFFINKQKPRQRQRSLKNIAEEKRMPEFVIVQCFKCNLFQVGQRRKDAKFKCKVCGSSQSVRRIFARSHNPSQLRPLVQNANMAQGNAQHAFEQDQLFQQFNHETPNDNQQDRQSTHEPNHSAAMQTSQSRWKRLADEVENGMSHDPDRNQQNAIGERVENDEQIVTALPDHQSKRRRRNISNKASRNEQTDNIGRHDEQAGKRIERNRPAQSLTPSRWDSFENTEQFKPIESQGTTTKCQSSFDPGTETSPIQYNGMAKSRNMGPENTAISNGEDNVKPGDEWKSDEENGWAGGWGGAAENDGWSCAK